MPPPHLHKGEDESFYILEGEFDFHVGDKKFTAGPGELVVLPKNIPHYFNLITDTAKALLLISPAGFEIFLGSSAGLGKLWIYRLYQLLIQEKKCW